MQRVSPDFTLSHQSAADVMAAMRVGGRKPQAVAQRLPPRPHPHRSPRARAKTGGGRFRAYFPGFFPGSDPCSSSDDGGGSGSGRGGIGVGSSGRGCGGCWDMEPRYRSMREDHAAKRVPGRVLAGSPRAAANNARATLAAPFLQAISGNSTNGADCSHFGLGKSSIVAVAARWHAVCDRSHGQASDSATAVL